MYTTYKNLRFADDCLQYSHYDEGQCWAAYTRYHRPKVHELYIPQAMFNLVLKGRKRMYEGTTVYAVQAGDCFVIPAGTLLCSEILWEEAAFESINILLTEDLLAGIITEHCPLHLPRTTIHLPGCDPTGAWGEQLRRRFLEEPALSRTETTAAAIRLLAARPQWPAILNMLRQVVGPPVTAAINTFCDDLPHLRLLDEIALKCHTSKATLRRYFRQVYHTTPMQYLWQKRLEITGFQLRTTSRPIRDIAFSAGFQDISHFYHAFRAAYGVSPQQWRA
ncbi:AraC family transcriptional regulator [Chitinophaga pendula]|uniref:AraC family transcriptional regulator n=1 Tax=Chitinophaga TaxID=79328 RepID=UPI000BB0734C|nr:MULTISPECIES: AraC family transcriptional regulator [Chitinophaga]ASZ09855.1 hypothetical protein CK934_02100 [Chitinophaga sp. MD30]UCJ07204.1 AraC family transcriptional regulator [Chitinophaga pendula]